MKTLPLAEAKAKLSALVDEVGDRQAPIVITKHGRPVAVLIGERHFRGMESTIEIMSDFKFYKEIRENREALDRGEGREYTIEELFGEEKPHRAVPSADRSAKRRRDRAAPRARSKGGRQSGTRSAQGGFRSR